MVTGGGIACKEFSRNFRAHTERFLVQRKAVYDTIKSAYQRRPALIFLERTIPFVRAALEGTAAEAAVILQAAERRNGLRWLSVPNDPPEDNSDEWLREHLWPFLTETHMVLSAGDLQATGCLLLDTAGVNHSPTWRSWGEVVARWANRFWCRRPAGLGQTSWYRSQRPWQYLDFYDQAYLSGVIQGYDQWRFAVWRVLSLTGGGHLPAEGGTSADSESR
jgi:hypothetical protein